MNIAEVQSLLSLTQLIRHIKIVALGKTGKSIGGRELHRMEKLKGGF